MLIARTISSSTRMSMPAPSPSCETRAVRAFLIGVWLYGFSAAAHAAPFAYVANHNDGTVSIIDAAMNVIVGSALRVSRFPNEMAVTPDGTRVYVLGWEDDIGTNATLSAIDTKTNHVVSSIPAGSRASGIAVAPEGGLMYIGHSDNAGTISVIDTATNVFAREKISIGQPILEIAIAPSGTRLYATGHLIEDNALVGVVLTVDLVTNEIMQPPIHVGRDPNRLVTNGDGTRVYVADTLDGVVFVLDATTGTVIGAPIPVGYWPIGLAFTCDGRHLYAGGRSAISIIETENNSVIEPPIPFAANALAVSADGNRLYVASGSASSLSMGTVTVVDTATNSAMAPPIAVGSFPAAIVLAPSTSPPHRDCAGDCDDTGGVDISEIVSLLNIALGDTSLDECLRGDATQDGQVTVDEIIWAVTNALYGCD
jgi:YVTN family beta-propeller protein